MKRIILALYVLGMAGGALAQTDIPAAAPEATPAESTSTTKPDNTRYLAKPELLSACQARVDAFDNKPCDVIFIGASISDGWLGPGKAIWDKNFASRHALDFSIPGDKTQNVLWRLNNMSIQQIKPKVAVVQIGGNNYLNTPHEIADGVKAVVANTQSSFPGVKIILVSLLPSVRENDKLMQADALLRNLGDNSTVYYLDLVPLMPAMATAAADGKTEVNFTGIGPDGIHPNATGYQIWADAMEPLLVKIMAGG